MALKDILVVSGHSGLYRYISKGRNNIIVESLSDNKRGSMPATAKISKLGEITVFAENEDIPLKEVFKKINDKENGGAAISHKSPDVELKKYFAEVLPEYDKERVYVSDIRKILMWYNLLLDLGVNMFEEEEQVETENEKSEEEHDESGNEKSETEEC